MDKLRHIQSKIGTEAAYRIPVSVEDAIAKAVEAYDQLTAKVERLKYIVSECHQQILDNEYIDDLAHEAAFGKPSASLLLHDAGVLDKHGDSLMSIVGEDQSPETNDYYTSAAEDAREAAAELRQQAAALEGEG